MTNISTLKVQERDLNGTARALRRENFVPGVIYGNHKDPIHLKVEERFILKEMQNPGFMTRLFELDLAGKKHQVLVRDVQLHPVSDRPLHIDFLHVGQNSRIHLQVPIHFINEDKSPGIKKGGVLNVVHHAVEVYCQATHIPKNIEIDLAGSDIGFSIHVKDLNLIAGTTLSLDPHETIVTIVPPKTGETKSTDA